MALGDDLVLGLKVANAQQAAGIATRGPISGAIVRLDAVATEPGRRVWDTVTGQWVTVVGASVAYLPAPVLKGVSGGE